METDVGTGVAQVGLAPLWPRQKVSVSLSFSWAVAPSGLAASGPAAVAGGGLQPA